VIDRMGTGSYIIECRVLAETFCLSETCGSALNYILVDRSHRDLSNDGKISREKNG